MALHYQSTRGLAPHQDLRGVALNGLADDGGLYLPLSWPALTIASPEKSFSYQTCAAEVMAPFVKDVISEKDLMRLINKSYANFTDPLITPLRKLDETIHFLELFHGPTLAFKDIALQFLGNLFEFFLEKSGHRMTVVGATSGDTGSAAMAALAHKKNIDVFILYPASGPSSIQRKQMTCVDAPNVHAVALEGTFDDCQAIVKLLFADQSFRKRHTLAAINSINWVRILAQIVYYFVAARSLSSDRPLRFVVPTGNFGNIYAAYAAKKTGLPVGQLTVACNKNDILDRYLKTGSMTLGTVERTLSPSMDIQVSSNFERLLFDLCDENSSQVRDYMGDLSLKHSYTPEPFMTKRARSLFTSASISDQMTKKTIKAVYDDQGIILDPHSAVGVAAAQTLPKEDGYSTICLGCAHPAKFPETIKDVLGFFPPLPKSLQDLMTAKERFTTLEPLKDQVVHFINERVTL